MPVATTPSFPFTFTLVGAGRVGSAVARLLQQQGNEAVAVASRTHASAARAAGLLGVPVADIGSLPAASCVLIGAGDDAIEEVAQQLASTITTGQVVVHFAGAFGLGPLAPVIEAGAWGCALHPVQACPDVETAIDRLPGSAWGVTCTWPATEWAHNLVRDQLSGTPIDVAEDDRPIWHAAAVSTSNGIAALMAIGEQLLGSIGVPDPEKILGPLARGTVDNAIAGGGGAATLTGPAVRGEVATIERHLAAIAERSPGSLDAYRLAARVILEAGWIDASTTRSIEDLLERER
ncbi:MAG: hypothetical protein QOG04_1778 [Actinomycetota bacterium]|jgi:predicted short-subunit dehydrogenase-like oxidoreductase (DUF2520 family)|nr:hypothetical protein [Actinomycetota bacterium]